MPVPALIPASEFHGLDGVAHFATGGEAPTLRSHAVALQQFLFDKSQGEPARGLQHAVFEAARAKCARLFKVPNDELTFLSSATEGINVLCYALDWRAGDNVVVTDVEFPSDILPWTTLQARGVEVRVVRHTAWLIEEDALLAQVDARTRVVALSQVSMFTGQRMDIAYLSERIRATGALFLVDATHAAGVVPVDASLADITVSSCYKWLLGTHGTAVFCWNRARLPELQPPFLGWASVATSGGWQSPLDFSLPTTADRFLPANPAYVSLYMLNNALDALLALGEARIEAHSLALGAAIRAGLEPLGLELMTPAEDPRRAGNTCFMVEHVERLRADLAARGVQVWGAYGQFGRVRISAHVHNESADVDRLLTALHAYFDGDPRD
ncbi:MAG: aminotransferase class V-fold PLP-dependent enzyme [Pseudomonadota bacterium]